MLQLPGGKSLGAVALLLPLLMCCCGYSQVRANRYLCGSVLDEALALACPDGFNRKLPNNNAAQRNLLPAQYKRMPNFFFFANRTNQPSLLMMRRARRGVYNECCLKICTHHELAAYCQYL